MLKRGALRLVKSCYLVRDLARKAAAITAPKRPFFVVANTIITELPP
jgi:hypothetical protein